MGDSSGMDDDADVRGSADQAADVLHVIAGRNPHGTSSAPTAIPDGVSSGSADLPGPRADLGAALIDTSDLSLGDLDVVGQTALGAALARIVSRSTQADPVVGFQSSI
jgi:FXSXX-COOH protein